MGLANRVHRRLLVAVLIWRPITRFAPCRARGLIVFPSPESKPQLPGRFRKIGALDGHADAAANMRTGAETATSSTINQVTGGYLRSKVLRDRPIAIAGEAFICRPRALSNVPRAGVSRARHSSRQRSERARADTVWALAQCRFAFGCIRIIPSCPHNPQGSAVRLPCASMRYDAREIGEIGLDYHYDFSRLGAARRVPLPRLASARFTDRYSHSRTEDEPRILREEGALTRSVHALRLFSCRGTGLYHRFLLCSIPGL